MSRGRRRHRGARLLAAALAVGALGACGVGGQPEPELIPEEEVPFDVSPETRSSPSTTSTTTIAVPTDSAGLRLPGG